MLSRKSRWVLVNFYCGIILILNYPSVQLNPRITQREMDSMYTVVMANMNKLTVDLNTKLKEQQQAEEQERLRKIQEALEAERAAKEADEQRQREEIENKRLWV